jgi:hypothetical protein|tara:strand:+ start:2678 stop:2869 length:192 start_codon:yes stop_codon:yes gene_type:complete
MAIATRQIHRVFPITLIKEVEMKPYPKASLPIVIITVIKESIVKKIKILGLLFKNFISGPAII